MSLLTLELLVAAAAATVILGIMCLAFSAEIKVLRTSNSCLLEMMEEEWATSRALRAQRNSAEKELAAAQKLANEICESLRSANAKADSYATGWKKAGIHCESLSKQLHERDVQIERLKQLKRRRA